MRLLALALGILILTIGSALAASDSNQSTVQTPHQEFKALGQIVAPISLTDEQLAKIEGAAVLANFHALPPNNPGTSNAVTQIPSAVFTAHVRDQWFGKA